jgi:6-pyruvoyl-tetrahydropterin synthase
VRTDFSSVRSEVWGNCKSDVARFIFLGQHTLRVMLPVRTELCLKFEFCASHSLSVREAPHEHLWRVSVSLVGETRAGMILNLPDVRHAFENVLAPLQNTFLNENTHLPPDAQAAPTCETLSAFLFNAFHERLTKDFLSANPTVQLVSVEVAICEPDGFEWGSVKRMRT